MGKRPYFKEGEYLECIWLDAYSIDDWTARKEVQGTRPCKIVTVGICVEESDDFMIMALNHDTVNDNLSCFITIPMGMIQSIRKLR